MTDHERASLWRDPNGDRWQRHDMQLWLRHDWERFYTPQGVAEMRAQIGLDSRTGRPKVSRPEPDETDEERVARERLRDAIAAEIRAIKLELADQRRPLELRRNGSTNDARLGAEQKYRPDQPRVPAGTPNGGRWTDNEGSTGYRDGLIRLAGDLPTGGLPEIPEERPQYSTYRYAVAKTAASYSADMWTARHSGRSRTLAARV